GKLLEVAAAHAVAAFRVGAAVRYGAVADGAADRLLAPARFDRSFAGIELGVEVGLRRSNELLEQGCAGGRSLLGAVIAERVGLALRFENEGSEPGREALGDGKIHAGHAVLCLRSWDSSVPNLGFDPRFSRFAA